MRQHHHIILCIAVVLFRNRTLAEHVYVAKPTDVAVISTAHNAVFTHIPTGESPVLDASRDGSMVYVASNTNQKATVQRLNSRSLLVEKSVAIEEGAPRTLAVSHRGNLVLVGTGTPARDFHLLVLEAQSLDVVSRMVLAGDPYSITFAPDDSYAYIIVRPNCVAIGDCKGRNALVGVDVSQLTATQVMDGAYVNVATTAKGELYATTPSELQRIDLAAGKVLASALFPCCNPRFAIDPSDRFAYVVHSHLISGDVVVVDLPGMRHQSSLDLGEPPCVHPSRVAFDPAAGHAVISGSLCPGCSHDSCTSAVFVVDGTAHQVTRIINLDLPGEVWRMTMSASGKAVISASEWISVVESVDSNPRPAIEIGATVRDVVVGSGEGVLPPTPSPSSPAGDGMNDGCAVQENRSTATGWFLGLGLALWIHRRNQLRRSRSIGSPFGHPPPVVRIAL